MKITLSNHIEISAPEDIRKQLIDRYTFKNPKHTEAKSYGYSTYNIDRNICLVEQQDDILIAPMGVLEYLLQTFKCEIEDNRVTMPVDITFNGKLRSYQSEFVGNTEGHSIGMMVAATGSGKTVCGIALAAKLKQRSLVLVKNLDLAKQWIKAIKEFTGLDAGLIGGSKNEEGKEFTIGSVQTLIKMDLSKLQYGLILADEAHNLPAKQSYSVITSLNSKYKFGLSATPQRRDGLEFVMHGAVGRVVSKIQQAKLSGSVLPVSVSVFKMSFNAKVSSWTEFQNALIDNNERNKFIIDKAMRSCKKMGTIILCSQVRHCKILAQLCKDKGAEPLVLHGQLPVKQRASRRAKAPEASLIIGTLSLLSEGIDLPHLSSLIFASPVSASINRPTPSGTRLIQSIGRCRRPFPDKLKAYVLDIIDQHPFGKAAWNKRHTIYRCHPSLAGTQINWLNPTKSEHGLAGMFTNNEQ
jgi:superfamily II DNA or RNA helicase